MSVSTGRSDAGVVDILFAVALGEGFFSAIDGVRDNIAAGQFLLFGSGGQTMARLLLGFLLIILSWLYYRRAMIPGRDYPTSEFAIDIVVAIAYMALLSFADWPAVFYSIIAVIWGLYLLARIAGREMTTAYLLFGLGFVAYFLVASASTLFDPGVVAEWLRIVLVAIAVVAYRLSDVRYRERLQFDRPRHTAAKPPETS